MKLLVITQYFWPEEFLINDFVLGLRDRGHAVQVLTAMPNYPGGRFFPGYGMFGPSKDRFHDIPVRRVPIVRRGRGQGWRLFLNYFSFALFGSLLAPFYCRKRFDLILVYEPSPVTVGLPALVLKRLKKTPIFFWVQDLWPETLAAVGAVRSGWILDLIGRLVRFIYNGCDLLLVQSRSFIRSITGHGAAEKKIRYFPNPAESLYTPVAVRGEERQPELPAGFLVVFAGNIGAAQDFPTILAAADRTRQQPDIHWVIIGDGRKKSWVEKEVAERGLQRTFHLLGRHPKEEMPKYFAQADVLLVTLRREPIFAMTIPSKVQSYLACGRPVIASLEGAGRLVIEDAGAGLVVEPENAEKLAEAVETMYNSPESVRQEMASRARAYAMEHFDRQRLLARLEEWMREFVPEIDAEQPYE
jgi:colanic acid biosynthesis glycosyl transferase WcaI